MRKASACIAFVALFLCSACTFQHSRERAGEWARAAELASNYQVMRSADWILHRSTRLCLLREGQVEGEGRADQVNQALLRELAQAFVVFDIDEAVASQAVASPTTGLLEEARLPCDVTISARLAESLVAEAGRPPGTVTVHIALRQMGTERLLDYTTVVARAGVVTPVQDLPQVLIDRAMQAYVARISSKV